jgi:transposase
MLRRKKPGQALERTHLGLPLGVGHIRTRTHDYYRNGTTTLFAALNYLDGSLIGRTEAKHRHEEWLKFLKQIDHETPKELEIHLIADNYATHKHPKVKAWLTKHPRFHMHFTPTSVSWMNLVERFFRDISEDVIRHGSFGSVKELADAILSYLAERSQHPARYVWKADGQKRPDKIARARAMLTQQKNIQVI